MMPKRSGQLSRADLLEVLAAGDQGRVDKVAAQMQLHYVEEMTREKPSEKNLESLRSQDEVLRLLQPAKQTRATASFWRLDSRDMFDVPEEDNTPLPSVPSADWGGRPKKPPHYYLLQQPDVFIHQFLNPILSHGKAVGRKLDTEKLVRQISQAQALSTLPRKLEKENHQALQVIDDRHSHLIPYWTDQSVFRLISVSVQGALASQAILQEGGANPIHLDQSQGYREWEVPAPGSTVLILSDLGALSQQSEAQVETWLDIGRALQKNNCRGVVLLPCQASLCDKRFQSYFELLTYIQHPSVDTGASQQQRSVDLLLAALAPTLRIEPGLLRQMRLDMAQHGERWQIGAEVESLLWQSADIQENHSVAASWDQSARYLRLEQFSKLSRQEKETALNVVKQWRQPLSAQVWFEEIISLDDESRSLHADDVRVAVHYFERLSQSMQDHDVLANEVDLKEWLQRVTLRVPKEIFENDELGISLQRIKHQVLPNDTDSIDPSKLPKSRNQIRTVMLYQQGELLKIMPFQEQYEPEPGFSPLATLRMAHDLLQVKLGGKQIGTLGVASNTSMSLPRYGKVLRFISDREALNVSLMSKPDWAAAIGRDQYGLYADINLTPEHLQRFRWIPAGTFMMGSPESEVDRFDGESHHQVTLTEGYWLADTTVTQSQWQAITGNNPSKFRGENRPVEKVSWDDAQGFIKTINTNLPYLAFGLPSEAQWEYACRAGTATPFSFGNNITPDQVNYNGNYPYASAEKGEYRKETIPVKSLPANPWGLYEMHGNVWEWCQDVGQEDLGSHPLTDPINELAEVKEGAERVIRGGSWSRLGRDVRSAFRGHLSPDGRINFLGFRLFLVNPRGSAGGGAAISEAGRPAARPKSGVAEQP